MFPIALTCPRCLRSPLAADMRFCPRCGLPDPVRAAGDKSPTDIPVGSSIYRVLDRIGVGSISTVYRCRFYEGPREIEAVLKVARDAKVNGLIGAEGAMLHRLHAADPNNRYTPFLPYAQAMFAIGEGPAVPSRQAVVLRYHPGIASPSDELYSLVDVRAAFAAGLDVRHMAWIWRRLLTVLSFIHSQDIMHGQVLPPHILIEPREHKLVLIDWTCAVHLPSSAGRPLPVIAGPFAGWFRKELASRKPPSTALDIALGARSMIDLVGGDALSGRWPASVDAALQRYFSRCISLGPSARPDAGQLLADFDRLIAALWGPRTFAPLVLPPKLR